MINNINDQTNMEKMSHEEKIWQIIHKIPKGNVASYGLVAKLAGLPRYARHVGYTLKCLPAQTKLPWHRVVSAKGAISFKRGTEKYIRQKSLLEKEGVHFSKGKFSMEEYEWKQSLCDS